MKSPRVLSEFSSENSFIERKGIIAWVDNSEAYFTFQLLGDNNTYDIASYTSCHSSDVLNQLYEMKEGDEIVLKALPPDAERYGKPLIVSLEINKKPIYDEDYYEKSLYNNVYWGILAVGLFLFGSIFLFCIGFYEKEIVSYQKKRLFKRLKKEFEHIETIKEYIVLEYSGYSFLCFYPTTLEEQNSLYWIFWNEEELPKTRDKFQYHDLAFGLQAKKLKKAFTTAIAIKKVQGEIPR